MSRPPKGPAAAQDLSGSSEAKRKLEVILETIAGKKEVNEACLELGISEAAFHEMRAKVLQSAVERLEPRPAGRPRKEPTAEERRIAELEAELKEARLRLEAANIREELRLIMPHVLKPRESTLEKKRRRRQEKREKERLKRLKHQKKQQDTGGPQGVTPA